LILTLFVDHACNLACSYCYNGPGFARPMPLEVAEKALDLAFAHPSPRVQVLFFGGEPLLQPERVVAIAACARRRSEESGKPLRLVMTTNGTLLDEERVALLEREGIHLAVSLDGDAAAHDLARRYPGEGPTWERVCAGLTLAQGRVPSLDVIAVLHPGNVARLGASLRTFAALGLRRVSLNLDYAAAWDEAALAQLERSWDEAVEVVLELYRADRELLLQPLHTRLVGHLKAGFGEVDRCAFGCGELAVAASGRLYPCDRLVGQDGPAEADMVVGHVDTGIDAARVAALRHAKDSPRPDCEGCALLARCIWWCGCVNRALTGRVDGASGLLCRVERLLIERADRLAATLWEERNPRFLRRYYLAAAATR